MFKLLNPNFFSPFNFFQVNYHSVKKLEILTRPSWKSFCNSEACAFSPSGLGGLPAEEIISSHPASQRVCFQPSDWSCSTSARRAWTWKQIDRLNSWCFWSCTARFPKNLLTHVMRNGYLFLKGMAAPTCSEVTVQTVTSAKFSKSAMTV